MHRQKPALRERRVAQPAGRRFGIVAYPTPRRSAVEADGESERLAAAPFRPSNGFCVTAVSGRGRSARWRAPDGRRRAGRRSPNRGATWNWSSIPSWCGGVSALALPSAKHSGSRQRQNASDWNPGYVPQPAPNRPPSRLENGRTTRQIHANETRPHFHFSSARNRFSTPPPQQARDIPGVASGHLSGSIHRIKCTLS